MNRRSVGAIDGERDELDRQAGAIREGNAASVYRKMELVGVAEAALKTKGIAADVLNAAKGAAANHFHAEYQRLQVEVAGYGFEGDDDLWEILDSVELGDCGQKAVERAQELGVNDPEILNLFMEFGMRMADFCFASEEEHL